MDGSLCFVCSRCEYPVCSQEDIITRVVENGTTQHAFVYELEDMLNIDKPVPCYSGDEVLETRVLVSEKILNVPLPPAAQPLAAEVLAESERIRKLEMGQLSLAGHARSSTGRYAANDGQDVGVATDGNAMDTPGDDLGQIPTDGEQRRASQDSSNNSSGDPLANSLLRFARVKEARVDLICIKEDVLSRGLTRCSKDRSADTPPAPLTSSLLHETVGATSDPGAGGDEESGGVGASLMRATQTALGIMTVKPTPTQWSGHPGNLVVEEGFVQVQRRTRTARCPWFSTYKCSERLECPDCHLALGYLFDAKGSASTSRVRCMAGAESTKAKEPGESIPLGVVHSQQKRERSEEEADVVAEEMKCEESTSTQQQDQKLDEGLVPEEPFPATFVALELKKIRQRQWGLCHFQNRYQVAKDLKVFRMLFPEAEELESVYGRLMALRTQSELYGNLLRKHKEQNDVQYALIESQKERISSYEEKLNTMQQIIEAQRAQLDMQCKQIKHQEELLRNHKNQVATQQYQIHVEQLLRSEQSRTIESQREQLTLMQAHLRARVMKEQLEERYGQLMSLLQHVDRQQQRHGAQPPGDPPVTASPSAALSSNATSCPSLPPAHLAGVIGRDVREETRAPLDRSLGDGSHFDRDTLSGQTSVLPALPSSRNMSHTDDAAAAGGGLSRRVSCGKVGQEVTSVAEGTNQIVGSCGAGGDERTIVSARRVHKERLQLNPVHEISPSEGNSTSDTRGKELNNDVGSGDAVQ